MTGKAETPPVPVDEVIFLTGAVPAHYFNADCESGDWQTWRVEFGQPSPFSADLPIRVILTPNYLPAPFDWPHSVENAAVVGVAQNVDSTGFVLRARNSGNKLGSAGFYWMAVQSTPGRKHEAPDLRRMSVLDPRQVQADGRHGDRVQWPVRHVPPFEPSTRNLVAVVTATNWHISGNNPAVVGNVQKLTGEGFTLSARNSDSGPPGDCSFNFLQISPDVKRLSNYWMASGDVPPQILEADNKPGDWRFWTVYFFQPFSSVPIVFLTATDQGMLQTQVELGYIAHAVGTVRSVTPYSFTIAARNATCVDGSVGFNWIAFGLIDP
jgi:hypothetical protein